MGVLSWREVARVGPGVATRKLEDGTGVFAGVLKGPKFRLFTGISANYAQVAMTTI